MRTILDDLDMEPHIAQLQQARQAVHDAPDREARDAKLEEFFGASFDAGWEASRRVLIRQGIYKNYAAAFAPQSRPWKRGSRPWWRFW